MIVKRQLIVLFTAVVATALPSAAAAAGPGGATPDAINVPGSPGTVVRVGNPLLRASANGISISVRATALLRGRVTVTGRAPSRASQRVRIERQDPRNGWTGIATAEVATDGSFRTVWRPTRVGATPLRVVADDDAVGTGGGTSPGAGSEAVSADADAPAPQLDVTVYRSGVASWYGGPGMEGASTACGVTLTASTLGVAHRTLPCGTQVALYRHGRTLVVPVIDRGPFVPGRNWDLTFATFRALGGGDGLVTLGALPLFAAPPTAG